MSEEVIPSERELYNDIVEMLSNGNFLQLNGKAINLTELNQYINAKEEEIERLTQALLDIKEKLERDIKNTEKDIKDNSVSSKYFHNPYGLMFAKGCVSKSKELLDIVNKAIGE